MTLRAALLGSFGLMVGYVVLAALAIALLVAPPASELTAATNAVQDVFEVLARRTQILEAFHFYVSDASPAGGERVAAGVPLEALEGEWPQSALEHFPNVPPQLRESLSHADVSSARLRLLYRNAISLAGGGSDSAARSTHASIDTLRGQVQMDFATAQIEALGLLQRRAAALEERGSQALILVTVIALLGAMMLPVGFRFFRRRATIPLRELMVGVKGVAEGDLDVDVPMHYNDEVGRVVTHFNDMTRLVRDRALQQGRLAAAGGFLAGVAHEVNNPLMAITAITSTLLDSPGLTSDLKEDLVLIDGQSKRAAAMVRSLVRFAHPTSAHGGQTCRFRECFREAVNLVSYQFGVDAIDVHERYDGADIAVRGDPGQVLEIVVNLLHNALDALRAVEGPRTLDLASWVEDGVAYAAVEDHGCGVPPEFERHLFKPFKTTKGADGNGLGLYMSRRLAVQMGGNLYREPVSHRGARFVLTLPCASETETTAPALTARDVARPVSLAGTTVLVADDEAAIRSVVKRAFVKLGADVLEAVDGADALARFSSALPDVVVCDLRMPHMTGLEFFRAACEARPEMASRFIFLSGDIAQLKEAETELTFQPGHILLKPVELRELIRLVAQVAAG